MYCVNCGREIKDGAAFCSFCGASMQKPGNEEILTEYRREIIPDEGERKTKSWFSLAGTAALKSIIGSVLVLGGILLLIHLTLCRQYTEGVKTFEPWKDMEYTYGDIVNKYLASPKWKAHGFGLTKDVEVRGNMRGTNEELVLHIQVEPQEGGEFGDVWITLTSLEVGAMEFKRPSERETALRGIFVCYQNDVEDLKDYVDILNYYY